MLAHIVDSSVHEKLSETNWNSDHLSSPSSVASTFEYDNILDSIKSELCGSTQDNFMFTDELPWSDPQEVDLFREESKKCEATHIKPDVHAQSTATMLSNSSLTPPQSKAPENAFMPSNVGGYELYNAPLSSSVPPTSASEAFFQQSDSSKTDSSLQFQEEQLGLPSFLQTGYDKNDGKLGLNQQQNCKRSNPTSSESATSFPTSRHFTQTSSHNATSTVTFPTTTVNSQNIGEPRFIFAIICAYNFAVS